MGHRSRARWGVIMKKRIGMLLTVAVAALGLVGCAAPEIPFDHSASSDVKTIGVITQSFPQEPTVHLASSVGQSFGLIGALVDGAMQSDREKKFGAVLVAHSFSPQDDFTGALTGALQAEGYTVVQVPVKRDEHGSEFLKTYPPAGDTKVDAYLDLVTLGYGYLAAGISSSNPYRPVMLVKIKLVRAKDSSTLMQDMVFYNPINQPKQVVTISPDPAYQFTDFDALMASQDKAVEGVKVAIEQSAKTLASLMK